MNKIAKLLLIPLGLIAANSTTSCSVSPKEIALITDMGDINDGSFNQESWEGIVAYASKNNKTYDFYRPFNDSDFARDCSIKQAIAKGAKVIVLPGFKFSGSAQKAQNKYPNVNFLLIDSGVEEIKSNLTCVSYCPEISGYMAGYAIAQDYLKYDFDTANGIREKYGYGYCGGVAGEGVSQYGFGYIQGICHGTRDFLVKHSIVDKWPKINIDFNYTGSFVQRDDATMRMKGWLKSDREIKTIFACGGKLYQSIAEACKEYNIHAGYYNNWVDIAPRDAARWVGVDADQYTSLTDNKDQLNIYTSALKKISLTVEDTLNYHYSNKWGKIGGTSWKLGLDRPFGEDITNHTYVGMPTATKKDSKILRGFNNFTIDEYQALEDKVHEVEIYDKTGTEYGAPLGNPEGMQNWDGGKFWETYYEGVPSDKIEIKMR